MFFKNSTIVLIVSLLYGSSVHAVPTPVGKDEVAQGKVFGGAPSNFIPKADVRHFSFLLFDRVTKVLTALDV